MGFIILMECQSKVIVDTYCGIHADSEWLVCGVLV